MILSVIFDEGLALLGNFEKIYSLVDEERNVEIQSCGSAEAGYVDACQQYVKRWLNEGHRQQLSLPRLEDLLQGGGVYWNPYFQSMKYIVSRVNPNGEPQRYFSLVAPLVCAYVDSLNNLFDIIYRYKLKYIHVKEFKSDMEAREYTIYDYTMTHMAFGAYFTDIIRLPGNLQLNDVFRDARGMLLPSLPRP